MRLRAYIVYDGRGDPCDGAMLAFARSAREARKIATPSMVSLFDSEYLHIVAKWLRSGASYYARPDATEPYAIEAPDGCDRCEYWYEDGLTPGGLCSGCSEDLDEIDELLPTTTAPAQGGEE